MIQKKKQLDAPVNGLLKKLLALHLGQAETVPANHLTAKQWGEKWGVKENKASLLIRAGLKSKPPVLGMAMHKIRTGKIVRPVPHYFEL